MKIALLAFTLLVLSGNFAISQTDNLKSLKLAVDTLFFVDKEAGLTKSTVGLKLAVAKNDTFYMSYFLDQAGELNRQDGNYDLALDQLKKCLRVKVGWKDLKDLSITHNNLGKTYFNKGQYDLAIEQFIHALKLMEKSGNKMGRAYYLSNIASTYDQQKNYVKAMDYYSRSLQLKIELGDSASFASIYQNLGILSFNLNDLELSTTYFNQSLKISRELGIPDKIVRTLSCLGRNYIQRKEYDRAKQALLEAFSISQKETSIEATNKANLLVNLGMLHTQTSDYASALKFNQQAIDLATTIGATELIRDAYQQRSVLEEKSGKISEALRYERLATVYSDSVLNQGTIDAVAEMEAKYEYHKNKQLIQQRELEIANQKQISTEAKLTRNTWISIGLIVAFLCLILAVKYVSKRKQARLVLAQNELIKLRNSELDSINERISAEMEKLQFTVNTKQKILDEVFSDRQSKTLPSSLLSLSKREMEVLSVLALGWSDQEISAGLFISKATTKTHLRRIYSKLLVKGRAGAVSLAHQHGIIGIERSNEAS